jgi:acylphosphatase
VRAVRLVVRGRVQAVGFRAHVVAAGRAAGAAGRVANRPDGTVEAHAEGDPDAVELVVAACRRGPLAARVDRVDELEVAAEGLDGFVQR